MRKQSGFTLIELVVVVVILGFLAVTAIPKFIDLTDQAKQANIEGMAGGFATGVSLVRAQWEAEGRPQNSSGQNGVTYDGIPLVLTTENQANGIRPGYVTGLTDGATLGGGFDANNCEEIWLNILQQPPGVTTDINTLNNDSSINYFVSKSGTSQTSTCHYYLKESLNRDSNGQWENPSNSTSVGNSFTYAPATNTVVIHINQQ
ncbi:type II secretion system protein [Thalassotalea sp. LPB0316]|uniref:type II secretion system protein n=1 Tax=Thalassotalea sp. LPB0316 TaxID=2769490 RepID=UPI0018673FE2|nr:type II secretion system protein [Thalassotalea sp. LPB0316]QOL26749.1 type II secretion system protein [Thalassotalea sp. LPB0316]